MFLTLKELLDHFKVKSEKELMTLKQNPKEKAIKVFSGHKPSRVKITEDQCRALCEKIGVEYLSGYEGRVIQHRITDETVDRYGDIVRAKGVKTSNFMKNPVVQFAHNYHVPPVGNAIKIWFDKNELSVAAWALFMDDRVDTKGVSDLIFKMAASGFMRAVSVGFMPIETNIPSKEDAEAMGLGQWGVEFLKSDLMEYSVVPVPANPNAVENHIKSMDKKALKAFEQKDIDGLAELKFFDDANILNIFADAIKDTGTVLTLPDINLDLGTGSDDTPPAESKAKLIITGKTSEENDHDHTFTVDFKTGNGIADTVEEHTHEIVELEVQETNEHTHSLPELEEEGEDPPEDDKGIVINNNIDLAPLSKILEKQEGHTKELKEILNKFCDIFEKLSKTLETTDPQAGDPGSGSGDKKSLYDGDKPLLTDPDLN